MRYPKATWVGAYVGNYSPSPCSPKFIVEHVVQGSSLSGLDNWFHNPAADVSAHFGIGEDGEIHQYVDTSEVAFAEMAWNGRAISIEHCGYSGQPLTPAQQVAETGLWLWLREVHHLRLEWTDDRYDPAGGVIGHGLLGVDGGNHPACPGAPIIYDIKARLAQINSTPPPQPHPPVPHPPTPTPPTVAYGSHGGAVVLLQRLLHIPADGAFGPQTLAALEHFQATHGLAVDGVCGPLTWHALGR